MNENIRVIKFEDLPPGGFAGIVERQMVLNRELWPQARNREDISHGLGDFIYLSMGYFKPNDGAPLHPHKEVDIVSFVSSGKIGHKGSLGDGTTIQSPGVQVQRAGTGMTHSEFSMSDEKADFVQIWFRPPQNDLNPEYKNFAIEGNQLITVHGGEGDTLKSSMTCKIGLLGSGEKIKTEGKFVAILFDGLAKMDDLEVSKGSLIEGENLELLSLSKIGLILIQENDH
ncbi:MAG: Pirin-like protein [Epsilonproteobacteria bacterium]|nr:MAG: Pirin-like protein [Campylobacterota bacterium]RLA66745.1 MAG: Pirin-like protein [Campylobacterota bacterium]